MQCAGSVPFDVYHRCVVFGQRCAESYARGDKEQSRALSIRGVHEDPFEQARAKVAECGFALALGLDPFRAVDWSEHVQIARPDIEWNGIKFEIKRTLLRDSYCRLNILPSKVDGFDAANFDALALVKTTGEGEIVGREFRVSGWITKKRFRREHIVSRGTGTADKLAVGSWFVYENTLHSLALLETFLIFRRGSQRHV